MTIPKGIRDRHGIETGSNVEFVELGPNVVLRRRDVRAVEVKDFDEWAAGVAGTYEAVSSDGRGYIERLRGPRDDVGPG